MRNSKSVSPTPSGAACADWPVEIDEIYGCHIWRGKITGEGYPYTWITGGPRSAHAVAWERERGPIPKGLELDHVCRRTRCVNVAHLELVTRSENERRKSWRRRSKRTHCSAGHDLWRYGRRTPEGGKVCLVCSGLMTVTHEQDVLCESAITELAGETRAREATRPPVTTDTTKE